MTREWCLCRSVSSLKAEHVNVVVDLGMKQSVMRRRMVAHCLCGCCAVIAERWDQTERDGLMARSVSQSLKVDVSLNLGMKQSVMRRRMVAHCLCGCCAVIAERWDQTERDGLMARSVSQSLKVDVSLNLGMKQSVMRRRIVAHGICVDVALSLQNVGTKQSVPVWWLAVSES